MLRFIHIIYYTLKKEADQDSEKKSSIQPWQHTNTGHMAFPQLKFHLKSIVHMESMLTAQHVWAEVQLVER